MATQPPEWIEFAKIVKELISENIWPLIIALFLILVREGIGQFVKRLVNLDFSWGEAKGSLKAESILHVAAPQITESVKEEKPTEDNAPQPTAEESKDDWFTQVYEFLRTGKKEEAKRIFDEYISSVKDTLERYRSKSLFLYYSYTLASDKSALEKLVILFAEAETPEEKESVAIWLSFSYHEAKNYTAEMHIWEALLKLDVTESKKANFIINIACCFESERKIDEACSLVENFIQKTRDNEALGILFKKLGSLHTERGNKLLAAVAYEKALEYRPDDKDILFSAAYSQSNTDLQYLSYFNYDTLITLYPDSDVGYNNLGVQATNLGMQGKSINYYRRAIDKNNTLAMANIANIYISKGFYEEAKEILQKALEQKDPHQNVSSALSELEKKKHDEQETQKKTNSSAVKQRDFLRMFCEARFMSSIKAQNLSGYWLTDNKHEIELSICDNKITASWEVASGMASDKTRNHNLSASIINCAIIGKYTIEGTSGFSLLGYESTKTRDFIAYILDVTSLHIMFLDKDEPMFKAYDKKTTIERESNQAEAAA